MSSTVFDGTGTKIKNHSPTEAATVGEERMTVGRSGCADRPQSQPAIVIAVVLQLLNLLVSRSSTLENCQGPQRAIVMQILSINVYYVRHLKK